ncbi:histidine kinase dimerization/phospho-acceptor domain-containing protein [Planococcus salinus]|uniref:histidine kinase n=1 Tax=Planococcus salinus TaxID=1848460 RepID=A0A3M8P8Z7_9BACL|nr:histidine kinase dimerization/phospho-acceptor domain-containing protein [Planococcus salinus]RNF40128.1 GHKL domain-containing protein [Planococcus salinus]
MKKWLWLAITSIVLIGCFSIMELGSNYIGKDYTDTEDFQNDYENFENQLIVYVLDPPSVEPLLSINSRDIEEYRERYGSLSDQIRSVQGQYDPGIAEANASANESLAEALTEERDAKIAAIRSNFADDEVVREKIQAEREAAVEQTLNEMNTEKPAFLELTHHYMYELTNIRTGETFTKGELKDEPYFEKSYTAAVPLRSSSDSYYYDGMLDQTGVQIPVSDAEFEGVVQVNRSLMAASPLGERLEHFKWVKTALYVLGIVAVIGTILLLTKLKFQWTWFSSMSLYKRWSYLPIEIKFVLAFLSLVLSLSAATHFFSALAYSWPPISMQYGTNLVWEFLMTAFLLAATVLQIIWLLTYYQGVNKFSDEFPRSFLFRSLRTSREAFLKKSIGVQTLLLLGVIFFWGFGTMLVLYVPAVIIVWIPATLLIGIPVLLLLLNRFGYLNVLMKDTEKMAQGRLGQDIPVRGKSPLADHARQLNRLKEGVRHSVSEQAKSERLKTELITNVSHDLRTPLTSIITYTDLLKSPELSLENRLAYTDILDRKSQRLKTLIEDLFEVSKMASGNMQLSRTRLDLTQLMAQALAEHQEEIDAADLEFRVDTPEKPLMISADGQKWWRVLDNLILNAIKYSLPGTRVYVNLTEKDDEAEFIMKNVTRYELGGNTEELFERFKRGDVSRQTEGSGLGLAIAQSIVDLHGGTMTIKVDGDLFKVRVAIESL